MHPTIKPITEIITSSTDKVVAAIKRLRVRHTDLMANRAAYRAQLAAAAAAVVALIELPYSWATLVLAVVAIYIATFTPNRQSWFPSSLPESDPDDLPW